MQVISDIENCRQAVLKKRQAGLSVGIVPTLGALHRAHRSLVAAAKERCAVVVVTIFVNPTQFGANEDLGAYPRPLEADLALCRDAGVDIVFAPSVAEMYGGEERTVVRVCGITDHLCGPHRPGHFDGVATVVAKLFHIVPADAAFFGEKDYQQLQVIRRMVRDLNIPIEIVACPTIREPDGLAVSSRNAYLNDSERAQAAILHRAMCAARERIVTGERETHRLIDDMTAMILSAGPAKIDYVEIVDADSLEPVRELRGAARICVAVRIGACRLIDNIGVDASA